MPEIEEPASYVPHRGKMLLLSRINEYNLKEMTLCAEYDITEDCLFYDPAIGGVPAWVGFEFMAQAIFVLSELYARQIGERIKMGYILSISSMRIELPFFKAGSTVMFKVKENSRMDQIYNFDGEVFLEGRRALGGKLTIMEIKDSN